MTLPSQPREYQWYFQLREVKGHRERARERDMQVLVPGGRLSLALRDFLEHMKT